MFKHVFLIIKGFTLSLFLLFSMMLQGAQSLPDIRVGVLNFGTVNWELETIKRQQFDIANQLNIEIVPLGSKNATHVALQGDAVDVIVTDWIWVSRQRHLGRDYTFVPYSTATGSVMVNINSTIKTLADLDGNSIGVAGGPLDKSWILLSAYTAKTINKKLAGMVTPKFAAPPLLNELFIRNEFEAVLNFWHYSARLDALGKKTLIQIRDILPALGIEQPLPMIGWVFSEQWADSNTALITRFLDTSSQAKQYLLENNTAWEDINELLKADNDVMAATLRDAYRLGIPSCFTQTDLDSMTHAFSLLVEFGGKELVGESTQLAQGTVWSQILDKNCN